MFNTSDASRNLLKYGLVLAFLLYYFYQFVREYFSGVEGFTLPIFLVGLVIFGGGSIFVGSLTMKAWRESQAEAAKAIEEAEAAQQEETEEE